MWVALQLGTGLSLPAGQAARLRPRMGTTVVRRDRVSSRYKVEAGLHLRVVSLRERGYLGPKKGAHPGIPRTHASSRPLSFSRGTVQEPIIIPLCTHRCSKGTPTPEGDRCLLTACTTPQAVDEARPGRLRLQAA